MSEGWVNRVIFAMSAQCPLVIQQRKYRCVAANFEMGPIGDIARLV
jgi:hypothetical protein